MKKKSGKKLSPATIHFLVTQKFRFDLAIQFIVFVNFVLLSITAAGQVQLLLNRWGIEFDVYSIIIYVIIFSFGMTWVFGYLLDRYVKYWQTIVNIHNIRNPQVMETLRNTREIKKLLKKLDKRINKIESRRNNPS